jgi:hypothetical protein
MRALLRLRQQALFGSSTSLGAICGACADPISLKMATAVVEPATKKAKAPYAHTREVGCQRALSDRGPIARSGAHPCGRFAVESLPTAGAQWLPPHGPPRARARARSSCAAASAPPPVEPPSRARRPAPSPAAAHPQAFLKVYDTLRDEVVDDALLKGQPADAQAWMREVRAGGGRGRGRWAETRAFPARIWISCLPWWRQKRRPHTRARSKSNRSAHDPAAVRRRPSFHLDQSTCPHTH